MATDAQITALRLAVNEPLNEGDYTNEKLSAFIDAANGSTNRVAGTIWRNKAAALAHLVDISEAGSSRAMSQLYTNALAMADYYDAAAAEEAGAGATRPSTTRRIERMSR